MSSVGIGSYAPPQAGAPYAGAGAVQSVMNGGGQLNGGAGFGMPGSYQPPPSLGSQQMSYMAPSAQSVVSETGSSLMTGSPVRGVLKKNVPPSAAFNHTAIALNRVSNTGWAGIGLFFERWKDKNHPIVVDIVHGGSAERDGSIKVGEQVVEIDGVSTANMTMEDVRQAIVGPIGSSVTLAVSDGTGTRKVGLQRSPVELWAALDRHRALDHEVRRLIGEVRAAENRAAKHEHEHAAMLKAYAGMEARLGKTQEEARQEADARRRLVPQVHALADEQRHAAAAAEVAAKRISELTLHFRSAEQLAREMTERAKVAERARVHEESLRLHAEGLVRKAEAAVAEQGRLLRETQQALSRAQEQAGVSEGKEARVRQAELDNKRLHAEVMELKGLLNREHADDEQARRLAREEFALAEEARERLAATARELEAARAALGAEQSARREADARLAAAEADRDHALLDLETARGAAADASAAGAVHLVRREEAEAARSAGEARVAELEAEVLAAREAVCAAERAAEEALADLGTARAALEAARRESAELQERAAQRAERLEGELRGAKDAVHEVQVRLDATGAELRERVHELESALEVRTQSAKVAEASANEAAVQVASLKQLLEENRMVMHDMEDQVVHCVRETRDEKKAAGEAAADAVALRQNVEASAAENAEIRTQLSSFKEQLVVAEHKAEKAVAMEQQAATKAVEAVKAVEKVASELTVVKATAAALETRNAECEKEAKAAEEVRVQLGKAEAKLETTKREVATLREDNVGLQRAVANVESELRESVMRAEKMTATVQELHSQDGGNDELFKERIRELEGEIEALQDDWAEAQKRLDQYLALPNPCGVGMRLDTFKKPDGNLGFKVNDLVIGLSADLSGVIEPGDELLEIQNTDVAGLTLGQVMAHSHGARGSTVTFRFLRGANGYRIILKRGAWGPEHCVVTPEDKDLLDCGSWPENNAMCLQQVRPKDIKTEYRGMFLAPNLNGSFSAKAKVADSGRGPPKLPPGFLRQGTMPNLRAGTGVLGQVDRTGSN